MTHYSVQPRDRIFLKGYGFLFFVRNKGQNIGENTSKNLSSKYSQKLIDHAKQSATNALETSSKKAIQKTAEVTGDLIENKIADRITKVSKTLQQNNSATNEEKISKERYISPEQRQHITHDLRLI